MKRLLALLLVLTLVFSMVACKKDDSESTTDPTETTAPAGPPREGVYSRESYSVSDEVAKAATREIVAKMGDATLSNGALQVYYWMQVYTFLQQYGAYAQYYMNLTTPLDKQNVSAGITFQQSFLAEAIAEWETYQSLCLMAEKENVPMAPSMQEQLDTLRDTMTESAKKNGYDSADEMIKREMGAGCDFDSYYEYTRVYFLSYSYYNHVAQQCNFSQEEIDKYFEEHKEDFEKSGIIQAADYAFNVRHVLIEVAQTKTDADWENCRVQAQNLMDAWVAGGASEESFASMAKMHSTDGGSNANGGLYKNLDSNTNFVKPFKDWYLAEGRQVGDYGLVKTDYGYHIMYLSDIQDVSDVHSVRHILIVPEGGKTDDKGNTTYSEEEWNACMTKAQAMLDQWLAGEATEDSFAALADEHSQDPGSEGGLYEGVDEDTNFVTAFKDWYMDPVRQVGDYGLVKSEYGYHIMYYAGSELSWIFYTRQTMISETCNKAMEDARKAFPSEVDYSKISLGVVSLVEDKK